MREFIKKLFLKQLVAYSPSPPTAQQIKELRITQTENRLRESLLVIETIKILREAALKGSLVGKAAVDWEETNG